MDSSINIPLEIPDIAVPPEADETDFVPEEPSTPKKKKYDYIPTFPEENDDFPQEYCFPRDGPRGVKTVIYLIMHILKSKQHMSDEQVEESIITISNLGFGRKWKKYCPNQSVDKNCLPCMSNLRRTERYVEVMVLYEIVEEIIFAY